MEQRPRPSGRAGFVLAGGNSSRMGRDKALLPYHGATLVEYVAARVEAAAGSVTLVGRPELYASLPYRSIPDSKPGNGPLAGIEAALQASAADWNLVVACDMPRLTVAFLRSLLERAEASGGGCLVPVSPAGRPEPLCAAYRLSCLAGVRTALRRNVRKMKDVLTNLDPVYWPVAEAAWFENLNTPADWAAHRPASAELPS